jgi:hypothetical protein
VTVRTPHYRDPDWHAAYCSLVRGEAVQAAGRARVVLPEGIPALVVTRENLAPPGVDDGRNGLRIADHPFTPLTDIQAEVLACFTSPRPVPTRAVAQRVDIGKDYAYELIAGLVKAGRLRKVGERGGWQALAAPDPFAAAHTGSFL